MIFGKNENFLILTLQNKKMKMQNSKSSCGVDRFMKKEKKSKKRKSWIQRAHNNINDLSQEGNRNKKTNATLTKFPPSTTKFNRSFGGLIRILQFTSLLCR